MQGWLELLKSVSLTNMMSRLKRNYGIISVDIEMSSTKSTILL